jgi:hypothetical protein
MRFIASREQPRRAEMNSKYKVSKEGSEWIVSDRAGLILAYFEHKLDAEEYRVAQMRADEQSQVLGDFNDAEELRCLVAELRVELFA